jgi:hypothetical protein
LDKGVNEVLAEHATAFEEEWRLPEEHGSASNHQRVDQTARRVT